MKAQGNKEMLKYELGGKLTLRQMIMAKCYQCCYNYVDGKEDCGIPECPLYPMMPYGKAWEDRRNGKIPLGFVNTRLQKQKLP